MRHRPALPPTDTTTEDGRRELIPIAKVRSPSSSNDSIEVEAIDTMNTVPSSLVQEAPSMDLPNEHTLEFIEVESINIRERTSSRILPNGHRSESDAEGSERNVVIHHSHDQKEKQEQELHLGVSPYTEDVKDFDLMNITITIYGITGILCEEKSLKKKSKRKSSLASTKLKETTTKTIEPDDETTTQAASVATSTFPTTVAASVKRNATSSRTFMETFYPSQPMDIKTVPGQTTNLSALWQMPSPALTGAVETRQDDEEEEDEKLPWESSFQLLRVMMKKPYSREQVLVENYIPEQVQIGVNLCRGTELMELGVATLLVTGEEEGQVMMHVPARPCANPGIRDAKLSRSKKQKNKDKDSPKKKKKKKPTSFKGDDRIFRLDENASLYVGIQVNPQRDVDAAEEYAKLYSDKGDQIKETDSQFLEAAHAMKTCMVEYREMQLEREQQQQRLKNMSQLSSSHCHSHDDNPSKPKSKKASSTSSPQNKSTTTSALAMPTMYGMLCEVLPMLTGSNGNGADTVNTRGVVTNPSKETKYSKDSNGFQRQISLPFSEIVNVKYAPEYAKSFFSGVTYAPSETVTETEEITSDQSSK